MAELEKLISDNAYIQRVRRYRPSSLIPLVARVAAQYWESQSWLESDYKKFTPWALADIARVSLVMGTEHRRGDFSERDLLLCANDYSNLADPELGDQPDDVDGFLLRKASEQLVYQQSQYNELGRSAALFTQTTPVRQPQVLLPGWEQDLFGCTLAEYVGVGFMVHTMAVKYKGRFSADWLENQPHPELEKHLPAAMVRDVLERDFVGTPSEFRKEHETISQLRRFTHNPLTSLPVVSSLDEGLLVPVPGQVIRKISPSGIWYAGWDRWGAPFAEDVGALFEQYVGSLLQLIPGAVIHPEIKYGKGDQRTVDWIYVGKNAVILVEAKSARPTNPVRHGSSDAWGELAKKLRRAYEQIAKTEELIATGDAALSAIPTNLPRLGLIVTMEPFAFTNANPIRQRYAAKLSIPTSVCSAYDLEWLVRLDDREVDVYILEFLTDPTKEGWELTSDLVGVEMGRNDALDKGWDSYKWGRPPEQATTFPNPPKAEET